MTAQLLTLIERVRSFCRDSAGGFIDDDDVVAWINEAYADIASRLSVMQRTDNGTTSGSITLPTTDGSFTVEVLSLRFGVTDVQFVSDSVFNSWADSTSTPPTTLARVWEGRIDLYPVPNAQDYEIRVAFIPSPLRQSSDKHVLPLQLERKLIEYAVSQAKLKDEDYAGSDRWFLKYEQGLPQVSTARTVQMPGPMSFQPEPTYFEDDARSHRSSMG
jgi:hypothetical protein